MKLYVNIEWIHVNDRLPENGEFVLICREESICEARYYDASWYSKQPGFYDEKENKRLLDFWALLPKTPYQMKGCNCHTYKITNQSGDKTFEAKYCPECGVKLSNTN
ncbi:MAG: DUF551 domain-containing protein [Candidatus Peribacteraceae bacterium]|nr:DUF551 domain-containing protein [Candidatus Peribacteraceae bacterium]